MPARVGWLGVAAGAVLLMGAASGAWWKQVPDADRARVNPMAGRQDAIAAGAHLFEDNCAHCHGVDGNGRGNRPPVRCARVAAVRDGELFWLLKNGQTFRGMPAWVSLPEPERWQIIAYLRSIQAPAPDTVPANPH